MIPQAKKGDVEAVAQALSTAGTMHALGDLAGALKWLRRATEAAADADADDRTLELAKAAADLATANSLASPSIAPEPPQPVVPSPPVSAPAAPAPPPESRPSSKGLGGPSGATSSPGYSKAPSPSSSANASAAASPSAPAVVSPTAGTPPSPPSATPAVPAAGVLAKPPADRPTFLQPLPSRGVLPGVHSDPWLVEALVEPADDDDLSDVASEKTRVGVPAYGAGARTEAGPVPDVSRGGSRGDEPALQPAQAVRVVVWRAADGVRVAPRGTHVSAIAVDAILVALDPSADLAAWLSGK